MDYENVNLSYTTRLPFTTVQSTRSTFVKRNDQITWRGAVESILVDNQALGFGSLVASVPGVWSIHSDAFSFLSENIRYQGGGGRPNFYGDA